MNAEAAVHRVFETAAAAVVAAGLPDSLRNEQLTTLAATYRESLATVTRAFDARAARIN